MTMRAETKDIDRAIASFRARVAAASGEGSALARPGHQKRKV
jgi:hypothetical protein